MNNDLKKRQAEAMMKETENQEKKEAKVEKLPNNIRFPRKPTHKIDIDFDTIINNSGKIGRELVVGLKKGMKIKLNDEIFKVKKNKFNSYLIVGNNKHKRVKLKY